jgi:photosystem II stability/assembly factor-like uncharacterized protein
MACPSVSECEAVTESGAVFGTTDGGTHWVEQNTTHAQVQAAQSALLGALRAATSVYARHHTFGSSPAAAAAALGSAEPSVSFMVDPQAQGPDAIDVNMSPDGQVLLIADQSANNQCWFLQDNNESSTSTTPVLPDGSAALGVQVAGTQAGRPFTDGCDADAGAGSDTVGAPSDIAPGWASHFAH